MNFHYTVDSSKGMEETVSSLEQNLKEEKFGILWDFDLTGKLQEKGMDFNTPYRVLEVCNPAEANRVISKNKLVGYFLPCKIAVYEDNGQTKIGMPLPTTLIELADDPELTNIAKDIEERLIGCIDKSK
ncbi:DUF302 domain-containing protein [Pseudalkalibacillus caeni]|uniref:DUF302 domain-containing protein n=1 Tax=Exobacillus caeni TaxID=2574798 RepID=A0A5R9F9F5_9BACL|nr:DUF302 domain-containing protein [Pseudalkalibacillus caeni]TLS38870.1 DUF302 domain-containing protein [Pseudalkalibacillus caeni]